MEANSITGNIGSMAVSGVSDSGQAGFGYIGITTIGTNTEAYGHHTADTGW